MTDLKVIKNGTDVIGTSRTGLIVATKNELKQLFGEPTIDGGCDCDKTTCEWQFGVIIDEMLEPITIYDYKEYREFLDDENIEWHIGAKSFDTYAVFSDYLENELTKIRK